ncbi:hypothetical protein GGS23DRAFT_589605 [Durotheca rogersii]|uniref:uncharacterized protein n=1 Tax=Durotheca rogersii TaxID=419775 RepID=UPI00221FF5F9|nr:uncharacterized protein GGS23DRAFT_589605 [Durotheca rogersii]KAI5855615.1 hypothetical protein GGS23DRAFT_589605 [Durotheca rogersii]
MAVLDEFPGIRVTVKINGQTAPELADPNIAEQEPANHPTSSKYIECINGANFAVRLCVTDDYDWKPRGHALRLQVDVDGKSIISHIIREKDLWHGVYKTDVKGPMTYDVATRQWKDGRCKFSVVRTVDDSKIDRVKRDVKVTKSLGQIQVFVFRCIYLGSTDPVPHYYTNVYTGTLEFSEKSLKGKAVSHGMSLSSLKTVPAPRTCSVKDLEADGGPIAEYRFHYRSRDALRQEMIIPRTSSPGLSMASGLADMPRIQLEKLARERLEQLQAGRRFKRERGLDDKDSVIPRPAKISRCSDSPIVIDLTDD